MKVLAIVEQADGSATLNLDLTKEEMEFLLEKAIIDVLKESLVKSKTNLGNPSGRRAGCVYGSCEQSCQPSEPCHGLTTYRVSRGE